VAPRTLASPASDANIATLGTHRTRAQRPQPATLSTDDTAGTSRQIHRQRTTHSFAPMETHWPVPPYFRA